MAKENTVTSPTVDDPRSRRRKRWRERRTLECAGSLAITVLLAAVLVFLIELIARGSLQQTLDFFQQPFRPGWTTVILFTLLLIGFDALFGRRHNGILFVAPFALLLAAIGHQKSHYLGDPLYPTDFLYSRQIMELVPLLVRERPLAAGIIVVGGAAALFLLVAFWRYWRRRFPAIRWRMRMARLAVVLPALAFFVSIMDFATFSWTRDRLQIIPIMWDQKENYASNGFAIAFALNVPMAKVKAPPSYEDDVLDAIRPGPIRISMPEDKPDIIVVMSESFWDPTLLPKTTITPDPMPTVREVRSGSMFSPEFGGMTANVEFEALTGFSNAFLPYGSIPYQQYVRGPVPSLANFFRSEGYETTAIHPFEGWFWNREHVYDAFGFDRFLSIEKLPPMAWRGPLVSDEALTDEIIKRADATERPFFTFAVSLQGHGPYEPNRYRDATVQVDSAASYWTRQSIRSFAEGIADADRNLKRLMDWAAEARPAHGDRVLRRPFAAVEPGVYRNRLPHGAGAGQARAARGSCTASGNAAGGLVEQIRPDEGCRLDQPLAHSAETVPGGRHRASLLYRLPRPRRCQLRRDRPACADLAVWPDARLVAGKTDRSADQ